MGLFSNGFDEPTTTLPDKKIYEAISDFEQATHGLASLSINTREDMERIFSSNTLRTTFQFRLVLASQYLKGYTFNIMDFGYNIDLYPVVLRVQPDIGRQIGLSQTLIDACEVRVATESELDRIFAAIVTSDKFKATVGGVMKLARENAAKV